MIDTPPDLKALYASMLLIRMAEERLSLLIEAGEVRCPCHLYIGQEAVAAGICASLRPTDYVWGGHRSHGHYLAKGGDLPAMFAEFFGKATGCSAGRGGSMHLIAVDKGILGTVPLVAATIPLAVGTALASSLRRRDDVSVAFFGDGAVEEGHFHESMNLAALYRLPVLFVCENNLYASHMGLLERRAADNIVDSAVAHGLPGIRIDGNDPLSVYRAGVQAVARARAGEGPTLIECRTFRWCGHVGPARDMDVGVKRRNELPEWMASDPLPRLRSHLESEGCPVAWFDNLERRIRTDIEYAVTFARRSPYPNDELTQFTFTK